VHLLDTAGVGVGHAGQSARGRGPGRLGPAGHGGSEELSGVRSIRRWMHRVLIEGSPAAVARLTSQSDGAGQDGAGLPELAAVAAS
jgi:hypothetical protein